MSYINIQLLKIARTSSLSFILFIISLQVGTSQRFNSLVGAKVGYKTYALSAKIALDEKNYLEGTIGVLTPQTEFTIGPTVSYHRHIPLNETKDFQFFFGAGAKAALGDVTTLGVGADFGLIYIYKDISVGLDINPSYFFDEELGFRPLYGINLRWVND